MANALASRTVREYIIPAICEVCGREFMTSPGNKRKGFGRRCSRSCASRVLKPKGRVQLRLPGHPLAAANGKVLSYRKQLYDRIGPGSHPCYWCGAAVTWTARIGAGAGRDELVVDHLDGNFQNNDSENLVPACNGCNSVRGYIRGWERRTGMSVNRLLTRR